MRVCPAPVPCVAAATRVGDDRAAPPADLDDGETELSVLYLDFDAGPVTALDVTSGTIAWGDSPFAPAGYPASTPLFLCGSQVITDFTVGACPDLTQDGAVNVADLLQVLGNWGGTGDGVTNVADLLALLAAWGPCAWTSQPRSKTAPGAIRGPSPPPRSGKVSDAAGSAPAGPV